MNWKRGKPKKICREHNTIACHSEINFLNCMMYNLKEKIKERIDNIMKIIDKIKVPVRPNRHYQRWGRVMPSSPSYRFRLDGRNNPKLKKIGSVLMTTFP